MYELFAHTADLGLRIRAPDLNTLFADAARALFSVLVANLDDVQPCLERRFAIAGTELDYLLVDWLSELLGEFAAKHLLFAVFDPHVDGPGLRAVVWGEPLDTDRHKLDHEVKAITYHGLSVTRSGNGWLAEVIVDI